MRLAKFYKEKVRRDEFRKLRKEVDKFNRTLDKITTKENKMFLPEKLEFEYEKRQIVTRKELKRRLKELEKFSQDDATILIETAGGNKITKWEFDILSKYQENAISRLTKEKKELETPEKGESYSPAQMGSERYSEVKRQLRDIQDFGKLKRFNYDFKKDKRDIRSLRKS